MKTPNNSSQQGSINDLAETAGSALGESNNDSFINASDKASLKLIIEREKSFEEEEEVSEKIQSWGVYIPTPEKTLIGLFWDKEIAEFFKNSIQDSPILKNLKKVVEKG